MFLRWYYHLGCLIENVLHEVSYGFNCIKTKRNIQLYTPSALFNRSQYMKPLGVAHILPPRYNSLLVIPPPSTLHTVSG